MERSEKIMIHLLGGIRMEYEGQHVDIPQRESLLRLFVRLLLDADHPLPRKTLAFSLWPDVSETDALANLRRHLHLLRGFLPPPLRDLLIISPRSITWHSSPQYWLDVIEFKAAANELPEMERAASLYRGELAPGLRENEFILSQREDLRQQYHTLLREIALRWKDGEQYENGLIWIRKLAAVEPWNEEVVRLQMTLEVLSGQRSAAVATYQTLIRSLRENLGTLPLPETMALYTDILNNRLLGQNEIPRPESVFVSRKHELGILNSILADLKNGRGKIVFISGTAGVGKTRLVQEALHSLSGPVAGRLFWGNCQPDEEDGKSQPYTPWRKILTAAVPILARSSELQAEWLNCLLPLVPDLQVLRSGLIAPAQPNAGELRLALKQTFHFLALRTPLTLVIEDVHWADDASLELLVELGETCHSLPLLLLVTHRDDEQNQHLLEARNTLRRQRSSHEINLRPFTPAETQVYLEHTLERRSVSRDLLEEVNSYSQGLPLLLHEAANSLLDVHYQQGGSLPSLRTSLLFRLGQLDTDSRRLLEAAAVLGFSFLQSELQAMRAVASQSFAAALDKLLSRKFLLDARSEGTDDYAFHHQLTYQIILGEINSESAALLHAQAGAALESVHQDKSGHSAGIALHYEKGGQPSRAARRWLQYTQEVLDIGEFEIALETIERAQSLVVGHSLEARQLLAQASLYRPVIANHRGETENALLLLEAALSPCREFPALHYKALTEYANILYARDRWDEAYQAAGQAAILARANNDQLAEAQALNWCAVCNMMLGKTDQSVTELELCLKKLEQSQQTNSSLYLQSLNHLGTALVFVQQYARAGEVLERTVTQARAVGRKRTQAAALAMLGQVALNRGRYREAIHIYTQSMDAVGVSYVPGLWSKYAGRGAALLLSGNIAAAREDFRLGLDSSMQVGSAYGQTLMQAYHWMTALAYFDCETPRTSISEIEEHAARLKIYPVLCFTGALRGQIWGALGMSDLAFTAYEDALQAAHKTQVPNFILSAQLRHLYQRLCTSPTTALWNELQSLTDKARLAGEIPLLVKSLLVKGDLSITGASVDETHRIARECLGLMQDQPDQSLLAETYFLLARVEWRHENLAAAEAMLIKARSLAENYCWPLLLQVSGLETQLYGTPVTQIEKYQQRLLDFTRG